jgi:hypothetical protein
MYNIEDREFCLSWSTNTLTDGEKDSMMLHIILLLTAIGFPPSGSVQYTSTKKTQTVDKKKKTIKQTCNTITRNRKNKKQPYRQKTNKTGNTNIQDNKITY